MSNSQELFSEIIPSEAADISGGCGGSRNRGRRRRHQPEINVEAFAVANVSGLEMEPSSTTVFSFADVSITKRGIFAYAVSFIRILF
ncbi:MAG: hypothetical protein AAGE84_30340 [Cyanobacteria bacterium P01_G01_bin.39]